MDIEIPNASHILSRNRLLQEQLRPEFNDYPITLEYPTILNNFGESRCFIEKGEVIAHASLVIRNIVTQQNNKIPVGLIGNVATRKDKEKKGLMTHLFQALQKESFDKDLQALILWSNHLEFYHKLGFRPFGKEVRYQSNRFGFPFTKNRLGVRTLYGEEFAPLLKQLQALRPQVSSLIERNDSTFKKLLTIPDTIILACFKGDLLESFAIIGKGYDLIGVVHEWGSKSFEGVQSIIQYIFESSSLDKLTTLSPYESTWLDKCALKKENSFVGLSKNLYPQKEDIYQDLYIWGLDSI